mgnify:FL=1
MDLREARALATQAKELSAILLRVSEQVILVATAEQKVADAETQHKSVSGEVAELKRERQALRAEMERVRTDTESECADMRGKAKRECEAVVEKTASQLVPLTAECEAWRGKIVIAKRDHDSTLGLLQQERDAVGQQVRELQESLKSLAGPLAKLAGMA